jgi:hypothetical protein
LPDRPFNHLGRLHVILYSENPRELPAALEDSIRKYPGDDGLEHWLDYCPQIFSLGLYSVGANFTRILVRHWPNDHRTVGNLGAFLMTSKDNSCLFAEFLDEKCGRRAEACGN